MHLVILSVIIEQNTDSQRNTAQLLTGPVVPSVARLCPVSLCRQKQKLILIILVLAE